MTIYHGLLLKSTCIKTYIHAYMHTCMYLYSDIHTYIYRHSDMNTVQYFINTQD